MTETIEVYKTQQPAVTVAEGDGDVKEVRRMKLEEDRIENKTKNNSKNMYIKPKST